ncbi:Protein of unknown function DUF4817 [Trinorchestia longiramus]|nr:Protein of unknown function DUF4817 [Trinorchestia longiramus]
MFGNGLKGNGQIFRVSVHSDLGPTSCRHQELELQQQYLSDTKRVTSKQARSKSLPIKQLTEEQRTFIVEKYFQAKSFQQVIQSFQKHFPERLSPTNMTIWRNVTRYRTEGTSLNLNKGRSGWKRTGRSEENVRIVQRALTENPQISARKSGLDVTKSTFNRIITLDLKWNREQGDLVTEEDILKQGDGWGECPAVDGSAEEENQGEESSSIR